MSIPPTHLKLGDTEVSEDRFSGCASASARVGDRELSTLLTTALFLSLTAHCTLCPAHRLARITDMAWLEVELSHADPALDANTVLQTHNILILGLETGWIHCIHEVTGSLTHLSSGWKI